MWSLWAVVCMTFCQRVMCQALRSCTMHLCSRIHDVGHCGSWLFNDSQWPTQKRHELFACGLWVMWVIVAALFNRSQYGALHHTYKYIQSLVIEKHYPQWHTTGKNPAFMWLRAWVI
jgi:hypothetical protein